MSVTHLVFGSVALRRPGAAAYGATVPAVPMNSVGIQTYSSLYFLRFAMTLLSRTFVELSPPPQWASSWEKGSSSPDPVTRHPDNPILSW